MARSRLQQAVRDGEAQQARLAVPALEAPLTWTAGSKQRGDRGNCSARTVYPIPPSLLAIADEVIEWSCHRFCFGPWRTRSGTSKMSAFAGKVTSAMVHHRHAPGRKGDARWPLSRQTDIRSFFQRVSFWTQ